MIHKLRKALLILAMFLGTSLALILSDHDMRREIRLTFFETASVIK